MSAFQREYKKKTLGFADTAASRVIRADKQNQARKSCRTKTFTENRKIQDITSKSSSTTSNRETEEPTAPEDLATRLDKWKQKRQIQKRIEKMNTKDPFVVRAVRKNIFSLPESSEVEKKPIKPKIEIPKKITKATERRIMRKAQLQKAEKPSVKSLLTAPKECIVSKCDNQNWKPSEGLDQEPLFGRETLSCNELFRKDMNSSNVRTPNNDNSLKSKHVDVDNEPAFFSPYVVSSRGKSNARNEQRMKRGLSLNHSLGDDIPTKDTVMKNLNISIEEEERTAQYFQFLLSKEVDRLNKLCDKWTAVKDKPDTMEDGQYHINQAVGQTNLLISKKFERFRRLVADCETGKGEMLVTCKDLQGFWDMMYMEIKNCDSRFDKLEQLQLQGWKEEEEVYDVKKLPAKKQAAVKKKMVTRKASSVITFLREKRKQIVREANTDDKNIEILDIESKTRRSVGHNKRRSNLLQKVQISAAKKLRSPFAVIKVSQMLKTPEVKLDSTISYINADQTPGKSILKKSKKLNEVEPCTKSSHKVNFNDTVSLNEVPIDEETQTKMDLAAALERIDRLEFDNNLEDVHAGKRLTFDDSSSDESVNIFNRSTHSEKMESIFNAINVIPGQVQVATPLEQSTLHDTSISPLPRRRLRRQSALDRSDSMLKIVSPPSSNGIANGVDLNVTQSLDSKEETNGHNESVRVLRNRSIISSNTPTPRRRTKQLSTNKQETEYKENVNSKNDLCNDNSTSLNGKSKTKKSRKSITSSEEVCNTYQEKTAFPITTHVRRSKTQSSNKKRRTASANSGLINSPETEEPTAPEDREIRLDKWKQTRQLQKRIEKINSKDPFVVRAVRKNIFSLSEGSEVEKKTIKPKIEIPKNITKATERIMHKAQLQKAEKPSMKSLEPAPKECIVSKCDNQNWKPSEGLDQELLFGRVILSCNERFRKDLNSCNVKTPNNDNSLKSKHVDVDNEPAFFSPYIVSSRGKSNARNEQYLKRGLSLKHSLGDDIPTKDSVMKNLNISIDEEERTAQYFQFLLSKEVNRLNTLCDKWTAVVKWFLDR